MIISRPLMAAAAMVFLFAATTNVEAAKWSLFGNRGDQPPAPVASGRVEVAQAVDGDRLGRIEATMRNLTGQVEELTHHLRQLQEQLKRVQEDTDFRLRDLEGSGAARPAQQGMNAGQPAAGQLPTLPASGAADGIGNTIGQLSGEPASADAVDAPLPGEQPLDLSTLATGDGTIGLSAAQLPASAQLPGDTQSSVMQPPPLLPPAGAQQGQMVAALPPSGDPRTDYDQAYGLIRAGQYDLAEQSFRQFLTTYPGDELAPEAQYWLGESFFARGDYGAAAEEFKKGYTTYPKSKRGPDTLLKLGLSMAGLDFREEACKMYALALKQYPDMSNGLRQRVKNEQASAAC